MRANILLSAASLLCVGLSTDAQLMAFSGLRVDNPIQLPEELVAQLMKRGEDMSPRFELHPGYPGGNGSDVVTGPRHAQGRANAVCGSKTTVAPGTTVTFQSMNYPSQYPRRHSCKWKFQAASSDSKLAVKCSSFSVQRSKYCTSDKVLFIENIQAQYYMYSRYCGRHDSLTYTSASNKLIVNFITNAKTESNGFSCTVSIEGDEGTRPTENPGGEGTTESPPDVGSGTCECGNVNRASRIVGGQETEVNEYPWQVGLVTTDMRLICGGSIISDTWVLTAAHCVDGISIGYVLVGAHHSTGASGFLAEVSQVIAHSNYDSSTVDNDIALLKLSSSLDLSQTAIGKVCLPADSTMQYDGVTATVTGWGTTSEGGSMSSTLLEVDVPVWKNSVCSNYIDITSNMMCAAPEAGGKDSCQGDSGGPLVYKDDDHYEQIGIVSWGYGCAQAKNPGVYARVTKYLDWIKQKTSGSGDDCSA